MLEKSKFESDVLHIKVGKFIDNGDIDSCSFEGSHYDLISARVNLTDMKTIHRLESIGCKLVDVLSTFKFVIAGHIQDNECEELDKTQQSYLGDISRISRNAFTMNRYFNDLKLSNRADILMHKWLNNSVNGYVDKFFVHKTMYDSINGFITCKIVDETGIIDLIAVAENFQQMGLGTLLVKKALNWFESSVHIVNVGTQAYNLPAVALYQRSGFKLTKVEATFHWWRK